MATMRLINARVAADLMEKEAEKCGVGLSGKLPLNPIRRYKTKCFLRGMRAAYSYARAMVEQIPTVTRTRYANWVTGKGATYCDECGARPAFEDAEGVKVTYPRWCHGCGCYMGDGGDMCAGD